MKNIVQLRVVEQERKLSAEEAWQRFATLQQRSKETLKFEDGQAAAKAYREFLDLFVGRR
jgi:hypothetical protein